jgi:hypothetical protein
MLLSAYSDFLLSNQFQLNCSLFGCYTPIFTRTPCPALCYLSAALSCLSPAFCLSSLTPSLSSLTPCLPSPLPVSYTLPTFPYISASPQATALPAFDSIPHIYLHPDLMLCDSAVATRFSKTAMASIFRKPPSIHFRSV